MKTTRQNLENTNIHRLEFYYLIYPKITRNREAAGLLYNGTDPTQYKECFDIFDEYVYCSDPTGCGLGNDALAWDYQVYFQK